MRVKRTVLSFVLVGLAGPELAACEQNRDRPEVLAAESPAAEIIGAEPGPVPEIVVAALRDAERDRRRLVVYIGASWCEPCRYFADAVEAHKFSAALGDLRFLKFDHDVDEERLRAAGYGGRLLPRFVVPSSTGHASARRFEGSIKGPEAVANIIPRILALFAVE